MQQTELEHDSAPHTIVPVWVFRNVLIALTILTLVTVGAAYKNWGHSWINVTIAITIATVKATLVVLFFMQVKYSGKLVQTFIIAGVAWFVLMIFGVLQDYWTRGNMVIMASQLPFGG